MSERSESDAKTKRPRGTGQLRPRGGVWQMRFYNARGVRVEETTEFPADEQGRKKAERRLRKRIGAVANGIAIDPGSVRFEDIRRDYLTQLELDDAKSLRRDAEGRVYLEAVNRLSSFEGFKANEIGVDLINKYKQDQLAQGSAKATVNRSLACLRRMFSLAQENEKLVNAPFVKMFAESKPRQGVLPHDKYPLLLAELPAYLRPVVTFAYRCGARLGEIVALRWVDVLWLDRVVRIPDTKNDDPRDVVLDDELETLLKSQYAARQPGCDQVFFRVNRRGHAFPIGNFRKPWRRACCKLGLGTMEPVLDADGKPVLEPLRYLGSKVRKPKMIYRGLIFHDLRRTFVSDAEHAGVPRHEAMKLSGHRSEAVYKRYAIGNREQRRAALAQIERYRSQKVWGQDGDKTKADQGESSVSN